MHIRTQGNVVQLCRWQVDYNVESPDETSTPMTEYVPTEEEADALVTMYNGTKQMLDTTDNEWIDGIMVDSLDQAREIAQKGQAAYEQMIANENPDKLKNDLTAVQKENTMLRKQVEVLEQQAAFHEKLFVELAEQVYA